jgi:hypothetical protein
MPDLSPQQFQDLRQQLNAAMQAAATSAPAQPAAAAPLPADFCSVYKALRPILQIAAMFIPGYGAAINAFIAVCDKICP